MNIRQEYFNWLYNKVCNDLYGSESYQRLFRYLFNTNFAVKIFRDDNRVADGIGLRYLFGYEIGYSINEIDGEFYQEANTCNILELMISLANRIENQIMSDPDYGDRTGQWFWNMIVSLGLNNMDDDNYNELFVKNVVKKFVNREYEPNGKGGLFTLYETDKDLRKVEIWYQAMWYLDENFDL